VLRRAVALDLAPLEAGHVLTAARRGRGEPEPREGREGQEEEARTCLLEGDELHGRRLQDTPRTRGRHRAIARTAPSSYVPGLMHAGNADNPLLALRAGQDIPFDRITGEHVEPAIQALIAEAQGRLDALIQDPRTRTFANTLTAL